MELNERVSLLWLYIDLEAPRYLKSWLNTNSTSKGYANDEAFFDEVIFETFEKLINSDNAFFKQFSETEMEIIGGLDNKTKKDLQEIKENSAQILERNFGSTIRFALKNKAIDLLKKRGVIKESKSVKGLSEEEKTKRNQRRKELIAIKDKDRSLTSTEKEELYNLRKYEQFFFGYERESNDKDDDVNAKTLTGNLNFGADDVGSESASCAERGMVATSFYQPEKSSERLEVLEATYELIEECFDHNYIEIKDSIKKQFIYMVFWDENLAKNYLKDLAKNIGFQHSNPTQVFQRFLTSVNECLTRNNPLDFELTLKETSKEVGVIMKEIEVLKVY